MHDDAYSAGGIILAGCLFIGLGVGIFMGQIWVGTIVGFGIGLFLMGLTVAAATSRRK